MQKDSYSDNPNWADVQPIPQDDGANPLVPIAYSHEYSEAMDYFRAVARANEKSQRVFELTAHIIDMNPAHYTIWQYRQSLLDALKVDLHTELDFIDDLAEDKSKNYQIWHHRQVVVEKLANGDREISFINSVIEDESKNYHAWSYRQWVIQKFNLWSGELDYVEDTLRVDIRNNSAWNHRFFVVFKRPDVPVDQAIIDREIEFAQKMIKLAPNNGSSWNYLLGVMRKCRRSVETLNPFLKQLTKENVQSPHLLSTKVLVYESAAQRQKNTIDEAALKLCDELATRYDPVRRKYWQYRKSQLQGIAA
ncbi:CAAX geranylgeranyltransferase alpha subunit [Umbelopsis nana]